jgi:hypothetical protein
MIVQPIYCTTREPGREVNTSVLSVYKFELTSLTSKNKPSVSSSDHVHQTRVTPPQGCPLYTVGQPGRPAYLKALPQTSRI